MILLLNPESVVMEMMLALRARVAQQLQIPGEWVDVKLVRDKRFLRSPTFHPEVTLNLPSATDPATAALRESLEGGARVFTLTSEQVRAELQNLVALVTGEINKRIAGLDS